MSISGALAGIADFRSEEGLSGEAGHFRFPDLMCYGSFDPLAAADVEGSAHDIIPVVADRPDR